MTNENSVIAESEPSAATAPPPVVSITFGDAENGRLPVVVAVVPIGDLDALGVFVDLRRTSKDPADLPTVITNGMGVIRREEQSLSAIATGHEIARGDDAVEALAREEAGFDPADDPSDTDDVNAVIEAVKSDAKQLEARNIKRGRVSSQIARAVKLTVGQSESFRAEIALPSPPPEGEFWYIRGRFATNVGHGLRSAWKRLELG